MTEKAISLHNVSIGYNRTPILKPFSLDVPPATFNIIIGANGSGKSTLLRTICGDLKPVEGTIDIFGEDIRKLSQRKLARKFSLVLTDRVMAGGLTVRELVEMGRYPYTGFIGHLNQEDKLAVDSAINEVRISHLSERFLSDISDGERQKAMIARAIAQQTSILILDEPTNFLDVASRLEMLQLLSELVHNKGLTVLLSTHDISPALKHADNVITILRHDDPQVCLTKSNTEMTVARLKRVFADRGITFDPANSEFKIGPHANLDF